MSPARRHPTSIGFAERSRELDHEHRKRLRGALPMTLSMRYLARAFERLRRGTVPVHAPPTPRPPEGTVAITFVGHATVMITTPGSRILVDPFLENSLFGVRRAKAAGIADADLADVDLVLVTHAHRDHLSRPSLAQLPGTAPVIVPPRCERLVRRVGLLTVEELEPGRSYRANDVEVTAVPVRHSGSRGLRRAGAARAATSCARRATWSTSRATPATSPGSSRSGGASARTSRCCRSPATNRPASARSTCRRSTPSTRSRICGARVMIPTSYGSFPLSYEPLEAPLEWLEEIMRARGLPLCGAQAQGPDHAPCVAILDHGESIRFSKQGA